VHRRHLGEEAAFAAVRALVDHEPPSAGRERAVAPRAGLELDHHPFAPMVRRDELLVAREDELDRASGRSRERCDVALEVEVALGAEPAAEQGDDDADLRLRQLEGLGDARPCREWNLRRRPHGHPVALPMRDDRARLDRQALGRVGDVSALHRDVGAGHGRVRVSLDDRREPDRVSLPDEVLVGLVTLPVVVDERSVVAQRRLEIRQRRQGLVLDLDQVGGLLRELRREGGDAGHDVALEPDLLLGEEPSVLDHATVLDVRNVLVREDREDARQRPRLRSVHPDDPCVRAIRIAELRMELTGQVHVGRVAADPGHLLLPVRSDERLCLSARVLDGRHSCPPLGGLEL
jgi:hypothetical protein